MDLSPSWEYIEQVSAERLANNTTKRQVYAYGTGIETLGVAGEIAARRFLGLPEKLHTHFDAGADIIWRGRRIDVKATHLTPKLNYRFLQWPTWKMVKADIILMTAVDLETKQAVVIGYTWGIDLLRAPVNPERSTPCHEIPIPDLRPIWELFLFPTHYTQ